MRHGIKANEAIPREKFRGPEAPFARQDRDKDGVPRADDYDWSDRSPYAMQSGMVAPWYRSANRPAPVRGSAARPIGATLNVTFDGSRVVLKGSRRAAGPSRGS